MRSTHSSESGDGCMARVVLDASVLVSAAFGGLPQKAVRRAREHEVIVTPDIREELLSLPEELGEVLTPDRKSRVSRLIRILLLKSTEVRPTKSLSLCRDPADDIYLDACLAGHADVLVTGDHDLLSIRKELLASNGLEHLKILSPRKFLSMRQA